MSAGDRLISPDYGGVRYSDMEVTDEAAANGVRQMARLVKVVDDAGGTLNPAAPVLGAGENHVGEVGGNSKVVKVALTVSTTPAYTAGDTLGGKITIANAQRAAGKPTTLQNVHITDNANQKPTGQILIFDANPASTSADNAAFTYGAGDLAKEIASIPVTSSSWNASINSKANASLPNLGRVLEAAAGVDLYAFFVLDNTPTFGATTDVQFSFGFLRD